METLTLLIQEAPYTASNQAWHALRLAGAALAEGMRVRVFLLEQGVEVARRGHQPPEGKANLEALLAELIGFGLEVQGCGMCLKSCCLPAGSSADPRCAARLHEIARRLDRDPHARIVVSNTPEDART